VVWVTQSLEGRALGGWTSPTQLAVGCNQVVAVNHTAVLGAEQQCLYAVLHCVQVITIMIQAGPVVNVMKRVLVTTVGG
jgi:hypothetical protein